MNTVFIPTAGIGSRLGELTKHQNKSLVNYKQKPVISHILDKFDHKTKFCYCTWSQRKFCKTIFENCSFKFKI